MRPSQWLRHGGVSGRVNSYEAPGRDQPDAGMYEKLQALSRDSYADYLWVYWQSYVPTFGWYEFYWLSQERREEMERQLAEGQVQQFTPTLTEGKPEEFFAAMTQAGEALKAKVTLEIDGQATPVPERGETLVNVSSNQRPQVKLRGFCDAGEAVWEWEDRP